MTAQNSGAERKKAKPRGRPFPKGKSGNPGGRPREERDVVEALRLKGQDLVDALLRLALAKKPNVLAIKEAFDRAYGKAKQEVNFTAQINAAIDFDKLPPEKAAKVASLIEQLESLLRVDS